MSEGEQRSELIRRAQEGRMDAAKLRLRVAGVPRKLRPVMRAAIDGLVSFHSWAERELLDSADGKDILGEYPHVDGRRMVEISWRPDESASKPYAVEVFDPDTQDWDRIKRTRTMTGARWRAWRLARRRH